MKKNDIPVNVIKTMYFCEGFSQNKIAKHFGVSQTVISDRMKEAGLPTLPKTRKLINRKYKVNEYAIDDLTPTVAWVLGWMLADGCIEKSGACFVLDVTTKDVDVLNKIKDFFGYTGPILNTSCFLAKTGKTYTGRMLKINSHYLRNKMIEYGILPNKSSKEKFLPSIVGEELERHFIKGLFEGDGSLLLYPNRNSYMFQLVGTKELLVEVQNILMFRLGLRRTKLYKHKKSENHHMMRYNGINQAKRISHWLYKDSNLHLDRKYSIYKRLQEL